MSTATTGFDEGARAADPANGWTVIERSWAAAWVVKPKNGPPPDPIPCLVNLTDLSRETGLSVSKPCSAKKCLIAEGLLIEHADKSLEPAKDYRGWDGAIGPEMMAYCLSGAGWLDEVRGRVNPKPRPRKAPAIARSGNDDVPRTGNAAFPERATALPEPAMQDCPNRQCRIARTGNATLPERAIPILFVLRVI